MSLADDLKLIRAVCEESLRLHGLATPGPWTADSELIRDKAPRCYAYWEVTSKKGLFWIAQVLGFNHGEDLEKYRANAELIALYRGVCPELAEGILALCNNQSSLVCDCSQWQPFQPDYHCPTHTLFHKMAESFRAMGLAG